MKHLFLLCLLFTTLAGSGQSYWETLQAPDGGAPVKAIQTANGRVYAEFYDHAVYCSQDNGLHWQQIFWPSNDPDTGFAKITVGKAGTLFAERRLGGVSADYPFYYDIYKSLDNGVTWQIFLDSSNIYGIAENSSGVLFAIQDSQGVSQSVVRSQNGGNNWQQVHTFSTAYVQRSIEFNFYDHVWVSENGILDGFAYSTDGGDTWQTPLLDEESTLLVTSLGSILYMSAEGTLTRLSVSGVKQTLDLDPALPYYKKYIYSLLQFPDGTIYASNAEFYYKSVDDGIHWEKVRPHNGHLLFPMANPLQDGTILATDSYLMSRTGDLGVSWTFSSFGINRGLVFDLYPHSDQEWLANMAGGGLLHTSNGGQVWDLRKDAGKLNDNLFMETLVNDPAGNVWFIIDESLFYSPDLGQTMQDITPPDNLSTLNKGVGLNAQTHTLFVRTGSGTARSTDNGITWETVADSFFLRKLEVHPSGVLFAVMDSMYWLPNSYGLVPFLFRSYDDGQTWERLDQSEVYDIAILPAGDIFAAFNFEIRHSANLGTSWTVLNQAGERLLSNAGGQLFAITNQTLTMTTDKGVSWQTLPLPHLQDAYHSIVHAMLDEQSRMYLSVYEYAGTGTIGHLFRTAHSTLSGTYLSGTVFKDADGDCSTNDPESPLAGWIVRADGGDTWFANTDSLGRYTMFLDSGAYFLTVKPTLNVLWETCADSLPVLVSGQLDTTQQDVPVRAVADCPYMTVEVTAPWLERCFQSPVYVYYCNRGTENADSAWVDVTLDPYLTFTDTLLNYEALGNNVFRFPLGAVAAGQCGNFSFTVYVDCDSTVLGQTLCVSAHVYPDSLCLMPPGWSGAEIQVTARCEQDTVVRFEVKNNSPNTTQPLHYFVIEDDVVLMQGDEIYPGNETRSFTFPADGNFRRFESEQEPGHPFSAKVAAWTEGCGGFNMLGLPNWYFINNGIPSEHAYCGEIVGAYDPNDKRGLPLGYGAEHLIDPNTDIEYLVRFQNTGTAPAHQVVVRDTLSAFLNPASLRMGTASHPYTWSLSGQGILTVTFAGIELPDSNTNEAASHGFFSFHIAQQPDLPDGTDIRNTASIYFDFNSPIRTNETQHRVGRNFILVDIDEPASPTGLAVSVFPNPVAETAVLSFGGLEKSRNYTFRLSDASGRLRQEATISDQRLSFARSGMEDGVYFFRITDAQGRPCGGGKLVLR